MLTLTLQLEMFVFFLFYVKYSEWFYFETVVIVLYSFILIAYFNSVILGLEKLKLNYIYIVIQYF